MHNKKLPSDKERYEEHTIGITIDLFKGSCDGVAVFGGPVTDSAFFSETEDKKITLDEVK